jgi:hypothetical protein
MKNSGIQYKKDLLKLTEITTITVADPDNFFLDPDPVIYDLKTSFVQNVIFVEF